VIERFEDVLDEGLDAITSGRTDVEHFLDAHPAAADELHAALEAATAVHRATAVEPQPAFRQVARASFADKIQARSNRSWFAAWAVALRPIAVGLVAIVIVSSLGFGTAAASADAAPGQPLYGFKLAQENFRLAIARDDLDRAALRAQFAERRVDELDGVGQDAAAERRSYLAQQIAANLQSIAQTVRRERQQGGVSPETRARVARLAMQLESSRLSDPALTRRVLQQTPVEHRPLIMRLLRLAQEEYQRTLQSVRTES